jgi:predicted DNA-binding transcriptional regulator AlpA
LSAVNNRIREVTHHLVGVAEIAEMLGVTRQRVNAIVKTHDDFPQPQAELTAGRIWLRSEVETWARRNGRL